MILASGAYWVSAGSYCFDSFCCGFGFAEGGWPGLAPAGEVLFFASPKKSTQKKGDPQSATPALRYGGKPALGRLRGAPHNSLRACGAPFGQMRRVSSQSMRASTRMPTPQTPRRRRSHKGLKRTRAIAALGPEERRRCALRMPGQAQRWHGTCQALLPVPRSAGRGAGVCRRTHAFEA